MLTSTHARRFIAPALLLLLTALLTTISTLTVAPMAAAAVAPQMASPVKGAPVAHAESVPVYRVVPGIRLKAKPPAWVLPVSRYHLTGRFGQSSGLWARTHTGLDFAAAEGTEIRSIGPGVVTAASSDGAFGNKTTVRLDDGTVLWYCHQSEFGVEVGQRLAPGDVVGYVGSTGNVTGPHLHLEVHPGDGEPIDPDAWLKRHHLQA
jgi:murein DD-endopeptidase MepM/ murein hydrolase activator NlpD